MLFGSTVYSAGPTVAFNATLGVSEGLDGNARCLEVNSDTTIGNMGKFRLIEQDGSTKSTAHPNSHQSDGGIQLSRLSDFRGHLSEYVWQKSDHSGWRISLPTSGASRFAAENGTASGTKCSSACWP